MAKAQAAAFQAMNMLSSDGKLTLEFDELNLETPPSRVVKIMNLVDPNQARLYTEKEFKKVLDDMVYEAAKHITIGNVFIIKNHNTAIGAEPCSIFLTTTDKEESVKLIRCMKDLKYQGRDVKIVCIPEDTYKLYFERLGN